MNILDQEVLLDLFRSYYLLFVAAIFLGTFAITYTIIPKVLWVSKERNLTKPVIGRSVHEKEIPTFGGVAFFVAFVLVISLIQSIKLETTGNHLIAAITVLFMVGLKDDLVVSTARVKLIGQLTAACFIIFSPELHLDSLHGFLGIYDVPVVLAYFIKAFLLVALINAYNLIDGINGLAAIVGIIICTSFGIIFYLTGLPYFVLVSFCVAGILSAFLRFNFSRGDKKIFMGDSGSLIIGLIIGFLTLKLLTMGPSLPMIEQGYSPAHRILLILSILFIPIFDTARVMLIRILNKRSPFEADRNHSHHVLLDLGYNHLQASLFLGTLNIAAILFYLALSKDTPGIILGLAVLGMYAAVFALFEVMKARVGKDSYVKKEKWKEARES